MRSRKEQFRDYSATTSRVVNTYKKMQEGQAPAFVSLMQRKYTSQTGYTDKNGNKLRKRIGDVFTILDHLVDESDPDTDFPQIIHAYQTGESLRAFCNPSDTSQIKADIAIKNLFSSEEWQALPYYYQQKFDTHLHRLYPHITDWSWLPLVGFIHDLGKVLASQEWGALPQWAVVGDTFPVGVPFSTSNVFAEFGFFKKNSGLTLSNKDKNSFGNYAKHCGFDQITMSFGHDEYCYSVLNRAIHHLPEEALYIIRFHSFYPWHTPRNGIRAYTELANDKDWTLLPLLKLFSTADLYSKHADIPNCKELKNYYQKLIEKFIPGRKETGYDLRPAKLLW